MICYYCESAVSTLVKYKKPICVECNDEEYRTISKPTSKELDDDTKALRLKMIMSMFKLAFAEKEEEMKRE